jgi:hypothetical protein
MKRIILLSVFIAPFVTGCAINYPTTNVSTVDSRPTLSFTNAPADSIVLVDGINMGNTAKYNGNPKVLAVEPGTHDIAVMQGSNTVYKQTIFVQSEHKSIIIH